MEGMTLASQLNALTRFIFLVWIILLIFGVKWNLIFLAGGIIVIIIVYYMHYFMTKSMKTKESFTPVNNTQRAKKPVKQVYSSSKMHPNTSAGLNRFPPMAPQQPLVSQTGLNYNKISFTPSTQGAFPPYSDEAVAKPVRNTGTLGASGVPMMATPESLRWCDTNVTLSFDQNFISNNQALANASSLDGTSQSLSGGVNPKTLKAPVIVPPSMAWDYWMKDTAGRPSQINATTSVDYYSSGYVPTGCGVCGRADCNTEACTEKAAHMVYGGQGESVVNNPYYAENVGNNISPIGGVNILRENFVPVNTTVPFPDQRPENTNPNIPLQNHPGNGSNVYLPRRSYPGDINDTMGYDPDLLTVGLPVNQPAGACARNPVFSDYNENLHTQILAPGSSKTPGVYTQSEVNDTINGNLGISYTQQFNPLVCTGDADGTTFTEVDPRLGFPLGSTPNPCMDNGVVDLSNITDPRFTGAGTSYRAYVDNMTGRVRYYYDDIDAHKRPNFITRNELDSFSWGQSTGPMRDGGLQERLNLRARENAEQQFTDSTISHRTEIQERAMRKINNGAWQQRQAPLSRAGNSSLSGRGV
jgi:hypothetical protein